MASPLTWTTAKPTQPGFYWYQPPGRRVRVVEVIMNKHYGLFIVTTGRRVIDTPEESEWAGPMEPPPR